MINKKLIHFNKESDFLKELIAGNIPEYSIVFIKDTRKIYTHEAGYQTVPNDGTVNLILGMTENGIKWIDDLSNVVGKEITDYVFDEFYIPTIVSSSGETLDVEVGKYYRFDEEVNTLTINLPTVEDTNHIKGLSLLFTTSSTPAITISANADIAYFSGYSINSNTTYEINLMFNGTKWIVAYGVVE